VVASDRGGEVGRSRLEGREAEMGRAVVVVVVDGPQTPLAHSETEASLGSGHQRGEWYVEW